MTNYVRAYVLAAAVQGNPCFDRPLIALHYESWGRITACANMPSPPPLLPDTLKQMRADQPLISTCVFCRFTEKSNKGLSLYDSRGSKRCCGESP